jgi:sigma-54 dependent transcriptional regulator, acetoin dehydrogenase operon transcriptional activator AcoR
MMMRDSVETLADWITDETRLRSSYRRLAASRLPVNLYSAQAQTQRRAATLLHGADQESGSWEELDGRQLTDDTRGDRTSLLLGGAAGGVALSSKDGRGLLAAAGTGTLFITNIEKFTPAARHILCRIVETGRYTPVGDPYPRPVNCRIVIATSKPLIALARGFVVEWEVADTLGHIALRAESVVNVLTAEALLQAQSNCFAAAS